MKSEKIFKLIESLVICLAAGWIGSIFTTPAIGSWYANLIKPSFNPPNWIFAPVWTILFFLMGIAFFLIWQKELKNKRVRVAMILFVIHLFINILWSILFFGLHSPLLAFLCIIILWLFIALLIFLFHRISRAAAWLLVPYILWVFFAAFLNFMIWRLNM